MERRVQSSSLTGRSPFSPKPRQSLSSKRSVITPAFKKSSRLSVSGRSAQSIQVILKSAQNYVERFGQPLPVLITEALTFTDRNVVVSARISEYGYAWVVCGRRLLIWQYRQSLTQTATPQKKSVISGQCFELLLPQSDLAHRAELVSVFSNNSGTPSCIAISPEGVVRYWPSVTHEGISVEQVVDLQGQECDSLTDIGELGCILATTTCSVVLVQPCLSAGRHSLNCHPLRPPTGWLGGLSKKMSSFIFGPMSSEHSAETRLVRVLCVKESEHAWVVYVLAGYSLQKWRLCSGDTEQLIFVAELSRLVLDGFHSTVWESSGGDQMETDTWLLDIQPDKDNIIILAAAVNMHVSAQVRYAMISIQTNSVTPPTTIKDFFVLKMSGLYREDNPADSLSYRFLLCGTCAYIYNRKSVTVIRPLEEPDTLEFNSSQDFLLGGSICVNTPIFFSKNHGLVAISSNDLITDLNVSSMSITTPLEYSFQEAVAAGNLSIYNMDADEIYNTHKDTVGKMKAAFIFHIKNQLTACQDILQEHFLCEGPIIPSVDTVLDKVVIEICNELLDDVPAGDPRWNHESSTVGLGSSYSMQVLSQLQDKHKALGIFVRFLQETDLWNRLSAVVIRDTALATAYVIGECFEKIAAAISLKNVSSNPVFEKAVSQLLPDLETESGLTKQDVLFREITKIDKVFRQLVNCCEEAVHSDIDPVEITNLITETNNILLVVLKDIMHERQQNIDNLSPHSQVLNVTPDYLPWTAAPGSQAINDYIILQQSLTCNYGARLAKDDLLRKILYDQFVSLVDFILDAQKSHLDSIRNTNRENILSKQYQVDKHKFISPLIADERWEEAAVLAEKYLDFETLCIICEATRNQQRLDEYMERFNSEGFSEFVYAWYLQENQPAKLIARCRGMKKAQNAQKLTAFLAQHPSLSWLESIFDKRFDSAATILKDLGEKETALVVRQKTMFSLSKLANLAAPDNESSDNFNNYVNARLELIEIQEEVPDYVLQHYGYDTVKPRVIPPKDLIHLYTCTEYKEATEVEFKKALDLLEFIDEEEEKQTLALKIWRTAILRDSWIEGNIDCPLELLRNTLFFKLADLALCLGANPGTLLPPLDTLTDSSELEDLQENKNFQYLLKAGYEHVLNVQ